MGLLQVSFQEPIDNVKWGLTEYEDENESQFKTQFRMSHDLFLFIQLR